LRLAASIQHGTVTASLILRKLGSYPRQNRLGLALREIGRMERTLFTLEWFSSVGLSRQLEGWKHECLGFDQFKLIGSG
jgi:TnpA family transposase